MYVSSFGHVAFAFVPFLVARFFCLYLILRLGLAWNLVTNDRNVNVGAAYIKPFLL